MAEKVSALLGADERRDILEKNLERQLGWIRAADTKATMYFAIATAMLGVLAAVAPAQWTWWVLCAIGAALLLAGSVATLALAAFPRTHGPEQSLVYFGGIAKRGASKFAEAVRNLSTEDYLADLSAQCHRNAEIAAVKYRFIKMAARMLFFATLPWLVALCALYRTSA